MSIRPAMESLVRGEKCGVIMTRRPASEKDSLWGLRMRSSSTMTAGGGSWPLAWPGREFRFKPVCQLLKVPVFKEEKRSEAVFFWYIFKSWTFNLKKSNTNQDRNVYSTFVEEHHGGVAGRGVLPRLVVPVLLPSRAARPDAPELTRHKHQDPGVEPASVQTQCVEDWDSAKNTQALPTVAAPFQRSTFRLTS